MPNIPNSAIDSVFFLYASAEDAAAGQNPGGTGFIVQVGGTAYGSISKFAIYVGVTNWHVSVKGGFSTIRLNRRNGGVEIIELGPEEWEFVPGRSDLAAAPLTLDEAIHDVAAITPFDFVKQPPADRRMYGRYAGVGEDVFMVGLFIDHGHAPINIPSARFGNISMLPNEHAKITQPTGYRGDSFVVDMHSRTGFSGSPVYIYRTFGSELRGQIDFEEIEIQPRQVPGGRHSSSFQLIKGRCSIRSSPLFKLLGILWGQFPEEWELRAGQTAAPSDQGAPLIASGNVIRGMSGMSLVIPAWELPLLLNRPALRRHYEQRLTEIPSDFRTDIKLGDI